MNQMGSRELHLKVIAGKRLTNGSFVIVWIEGDSKVQEAKTAVDHNGGSDPTWNFSYDFTFDNYLADQNGLFLIFKLKTQGVLGDEDIGEVVVPIKELLDSQGDDKSPQILSCRVWTPGVGFQGELQFSYKFGDLVPTSADGAAFKANKPIKAYPEYFSSVRYDAPPWGNMQYGHPLPNAAGYVYPSPPQSGYAEYPPQGGDGHAARYAYPPLLQPVYGTYPPQGGEGYAARYRPPLLQPDHAAYPPRRVNRYQLIQMGLQAGMLGVSSGHLIEDLDSNGADGGGDYVDMSGF